MSLFTRMEKANRTCFRGECMIQTIYQCDNCGDEKESERNLYGDTPEEPKLWTHFYSFIPSLPVKKFHICDACTLKIFEWFEANRAEKGLPPLTKPE